MNDYTGMNSDYMFGHTGEQTASIKEDKLDQVLKRLDRIEDILNRPHDPYIYPGDNTPQPYYSNTTTCSKCGMVFEGAVSYYCPQNDCPTFMKVT